MDIEEGKTLVRRVVSVIISCETDEQLYGALKYTMLASKALNKKAGVMKESLFIPTVNRAVGYAYCKLGLDLCGVDV